MGTACWAPSEAHTTYITQYICGRAALRHCAPMNGVPEKSETRHFKTKSHNLSIAAIEADQRELDYAPSGARPAASAGAGVVAAEAAGNRPPP